MTNEQMNVNTSGAMLLEDELKETVKIKGHTYNLDDRQQYSNFTVYYISKINK